ncbi:Peptidase_S9 domain-containing protein [Cephalotus follicularis]|uniref:Peptidase_S9 domain-containing protein n=1 Tax=Cephalotus follicularis TaxID=3775 RepID=A0A1Q3BLX3_CEPFO|nr:Peptidase_S9 domain-containing protein [Cephalotus follicularis]
MGLSGTVTPTLTRLYFSSCSSLNFIQKRTLHSVSVKRMASSVSASPQDHKITAPYGSWKSPITADVVSGASKRLGGTAIDAQGHLFWLESRPNESGRSVLVKEPEKPGDEPVDITPKEFAVRTVAQEYGGGAFKISGDTLIFSNYKDQRLYKQSVTSKDSSPVPLTPDYGAPVVSYADGVFDWRFNRFVTVREDRRESSLNPITTIVTVGLDDKDIKEPKVLESGNDFYAFPRVDPKGERIAWVAWDHPNMPWDKSEVWVGYISENGDVYKRVCVAGCDHNVVESPTEPKWSSKGELFFITDRESGFWNLYKWIESDDKAVAVYSLEAEFSRPLWVFGNNSYEFIQNNEDNTIIACSYRQNGRSYLGILDDGQSSLSLLDIPFTDIDNITAGSHCLYVEGASGVHPSSVAKVTLDKHQYKVVDFELVWSSSPDSINYKSYFSLPEFIEFPTEVPGQNAYAYFYPPSNPIYQASKEEKPPLLLKSHGGPTSETRGMLNLSIQYWTSRGWAFVDVNYGGSTGYGREFRERLLGRWGIVDVNDCCSCAKFLVDSGKVDGERLCITGGSAGGYTTLAALAFTKTFKAGASLYGVADLSMLRAETHKFESHYIDNLVGTEKDYFERSPINFVNNFSCPIILFQGLEDKVVPPDQARKIYRALKEKGLPVALIEYEGEQHGFRKAENIKFTLEQQMVFFARLVGRFTVADDIAAITVDNFD